MPNYASPGLRADEYNGGGLPGTASGSRQIPQNIEAEQSVLAACMLNPDAIDEVASKLTPESFFRPAHQTIFRSMLDLHARNIPIDQLSLAENLRANGQLDAIGGDSYLVDLADNTFALTNWVTHTDIVKRQAVLRDLIYASSQDRKSVV